MPELPKIQRQHSQAEGTVSYVEQIEIAVTDIEDKRKALSLVISIEDTISNGVIYIRKSDHQALGTVREVLEALVNESGILIQNERGVMTLDSPPRSMDDLADDTNGQDKG